MVHWASRVRLVSDAHLPAWGLACIHRCQLLWALLDVPKPIRRVIHFKGIVVFSGRLSRRSSERRRMVKGSRILHSELAWHGGHADDPHP